MVQRQNLWFIFRYKSSETLKRKVWEWRSVVHELKNCCTYIKWGSLQKEWKIIPQRLKDCYAW